jgi:hypothetical protein
MLDVVGRRVDDAGDERPVGGQWLACEQAMLVGMAGIGEGQDEAAHPCPVETGKDLLQRDVEEVRALVVPPAHVEPDPVGRNPGERRVDRSDDEVDEGEEILQRPVREQRVTLHREVRRVDLEHQPVRDDLPVLDRQRVGERGDVILQPGVEIVRHGGRDDAG